MRTILITVILIGLLEVISGGQVNSSQRAGAVLHEKPDSTTITSVPRFVEVSGNLFVAINTNKSLVLSEGTVIEFDFGRKGNLKSFHVNDANQNIIDQGEADLLVMIHPELALALKSDKLAGLKVTDGDREYKFTVDEFWQPHAYLTSWR